MNPGPILVALVEGLTYVAIGLAVVLVIIGVVIWWHRPR